GGRQATPAPLGTQGDDRGRRLPFERVASPGGLYETPAPVATAAAHLPQAPTLRGLAPLAPLGGEARPGEPTPRVTAFDMMNGPATLEDFVFPEAGAVTNAPADGGLPEPDVVAVVDALSLADGLDALHAATD